MKLSDFTEKEQNYIAAIAKNKMHNIINSKEKTVDPHLIEACNLLLDQLREIIEGKEFYPFFINVLTETIDGNILALRETSQKLLKLKK